MITATGIDLVSIERVRAMTESGGAVFVDQTWTAGEQQYCNGRPECLAARWSAKEAAMKALGSGFPDLEHLDIEVVRGQAHQPGLKLTGDVLDLAREAGLTTWTVSLSHDMGLAVAVVFATGDVA